MIDPTPLHVLLVAGCFGAIYATIVAWLVRKDDQRRAARAFMARLGHPDWTAVTESIRQMGVAMAQLVPAVTAAADAIRALGRSMAGSLGKAQRPPPPPCWQDEAWRYYIETIDPESS